MKIGAYSFAVSGRIADNLSAIRRGVETAARKDVRLLAFPECALCGYPPRDIRSPAEVDFEALGRAYGGLRALAAAHDMCLLVGTIGRAGDAYDNEARVFLPGGGETVYRKRALWGWDGDHFSPGSDPGVFDLDGFRIGVRICFEIRFPEYFRELYRVRTDLNVVLFYDVADEDGPERYQLLMSHIRTRSVENVCHTLSVNAVKPFQTAPTALVDPSGRVLCERERGVEGLLAWELEKRPPDFGERGRREMSDQLLGL